MNTLNFHQRSMMAQKYQSYDILKIPETLSVRDWAEKNRSLPKSVSPWPGKYSAARVPFQVEPQNSFEDPEVQLTILWWASRLGKTEMINNLIGKKIDNDPSSIIMMYPTLDSASRWSKKFLTPMISNTPTLRGKIKDARSRDSSNTILEKLFPGGSISMIGANSPSGLRQQQASVAIGDEIDACEGSTGGEGDPIALLFKRTENHPDSIQVLASTGTIKGMSRIENWYEKSDQRKWFVPCIKCGHYQILHWSQVKWPKDSHQEAILECESCAAAHNDDQRIEMILNGVWRPTAPFTGNRGYWLNGLNTTFPPKKGYKSKLHQIAMDAHDAKHSSNQKETTRVWVNTFLCETYADEAESLEASPLYMRRENYSPEMLPQGVLVLVAGVDIQDDRIECEIDGFGLNEESWGISYNVIMGNPVTLEPWKILDDLLLKTYNHPSGNSLSVARCCIDTGHKNRMVYLFVKPRQIRGIYAVKGASTPGLPIVSRPRKSSVERASLFLIGTDTAKELIYSRLKLNEHGAGYMHFPIGHGFDEEYFKQLVSEKWISIFEKGRPMRKWIKNGKNEALDIRVYSQAALAILRPNFAVIAEKMKAIGTPAVPRGTIQKPPNLRRAGGGFIGGWKQF